MGSTSRQNFGTCLPGRTRPSSSANASRNPRAIRAWLHRSIMGTSAELLLANGAPIRIRHRPEQGNHYCRLSIRHIVQLQKTLILGLLCSALYMAKLTGTVREILCLTCARSCSAEACVRKEAAHFWGRPPWRTRSLVSQARDCNRACFRPRWKCSPDLLRRQACLLSRCGGPVLGSPELG